MLIVLLSLLACPSANTPPTAAEVILRAGLSPVVPATPEPLPVIHAPVPVGAADCSQAKNTCPDYAPSWSGACPAGSRCLQFTNASTTEAVALSYQIGCNGDGTKGAPQCDCTPGPVLLPGGSAYFAIVNGDYASCLPSWTPACLTAGLAVIANAPAASCAAGTRVEFTAGNAGDPYGKFDSWDIDAEPAKGGGQFYSIPVAFAPNLVCANDYANHDCRPLGCTSPTCPDAYTTPTSGTCPDGRSPQVGCQDTFSKGVGFTITYFPETSASCGSAIPCNAATP